MTINGRSIWVHIYTLDPNILVCRPHALLCGFVCPNERPSTNQNQQFWPQGLRSRGYYPSSRLCVLAAGYTPYVDTRVLHFSDHLRIQKEYQDNMSKFIQCSSMISFMSTYNEKIDCS